MEKTGWKVLAITLLVIVILESCLIGWAFNMGSEIIDNENECAYNVCEDYSTYGYDGWDKICSCYEGNEIVIQKYLG